MADLVEIKVPDIGDFSDVPIIEVLVSPGDEVAPEDPLITLESDKATMDVPAPQAGVVRELKVAVGDAVSEGSVILVLEGVAAGGGEAPAGGAPAEEHVVEEAEEVPPDHQPSYGSEAGVYETIEVVVPDIGDFSDVPIIEIFVSPGDHVSVEDPLITL